MFDPETFGEAMGAAIREAVAPLQKRIGELESKIAKPADVQAQIERAVAAAVSAVPAPKDGKDAQPVDIDAIVKQVIEKVPAPANGKDGQTGENGKSLTLEDVRPMLDMALAGVRTDARKSIDDAIKEIPVPQNGRDGQNGASVTLADVQPILADAIKQVNERAETVLSAAVAAIPVPSNGKDGTNGKDGERGEKGLDGAGLAGAMIDRDGALQVTFTNGEVKNLGPVVGRNGDDGKDGLSLDAFELEYLPESHEIQLKATAAGRVKELRYPAGGIRPAGYWREGTKAEAGEAWVHDGSLWIARKSTPTKPSTGMDDWIIAARKGRDGERGAKGIDGTPPAPIKLRD